MPQPSYRQWIARGLAHALLADAHKPGATSSSALLARAAACLGQSPVWLKQLVEPLAQWSAMTWQKLDVASLAVKIADSEAFSLAFTDGAKPVIRRLILRTAEMLPRPLGLHVCAIPDVPTVQDLARWLNLPDDKLSWLAPVAPSCTEHYRYKLQAKRLGGLRLLEIPKVELKRVQRMVLDGLLRHIPIHEAAHGFSCGRSVRTHAAAHVGQAVVIRFDLRDFFGSVTAAQVFAIWRTLGYPVGVASSLTALCTHRTADMVVQRLRETGGPDDGLSWLGAKRLRAAHLPQGAPTSPALANLCAFRLDLRLEGLAWVFGARYTRYADDLVFSGPPALRQQFRALQEWVAAIAADEGFVLHPDKTRCLPQHVQQRVTGVVVNTKVNIPRKEFDRLKACLHQCVQRGPDSQNVSHIADFRGHLLGRIAWVAQLNPGKKDKLMGLFDRINWSL